MRRICLVFLLFPLVMSVGLAAQKPRDAARWIEELKKTPADELGTGLPHQNFAEWFGALVAPNEIGFKFEECDVYNPADGTTDKLSCVNAYTKPPHPGWRRWIQLSFIVGSIPAGEAAAKSPGTKWVSYIFQRGIESPVNPHMARPDRVFSELGDLENIVRRPQPKVSARQEGPASNLRGRPT